MIRSTVAGWHRLGGRERVDVVRSAACLVTVGVLLHAGGLRRASTFLDRIPSRETRRGVDVATLVLSVERATRVVPARCLTRSLTAWWLLARRGVRSEVVVGVARDPRARVKAHAWLEVQGQVANDAADVREHFDVLPDAHERARRLVAPGP